MLAEERKNMIARIVNDIGAVEVKELSRRFAVTADSIRKDLNVLQSRGLVRRIYGGAVKMTDDQERYVSQRKGKFVADKRRLAQKAVRLLKDGDVIFLDISTTNIELAKMLRASDMSLTVVTNMIDVMIMMMEDEHNSIIFIGGEFSEGRDGFVGAITNQSVEKYRFDAAFMGVAGVDPILNTASTYTPEDASTKAVILNCSRKKYMLLETRKILRRAEYPYASIGDFDGLIVERALTDEQRAQFEQYNVKIY